ncbi:Pogo transposable element with KRAB domain like protein [Argiope bruennichi]|uniref:Pogo transposable element with KRAB domain like protein n=1 Tax=Argiope bruennichi TaxID=94029 RepID=A0A8T0FEA1_ARGBR|nr:Pogo transposable element with KRAB domain like protein [Argiope bruennichi]
MDEVPLTFDCPPNRTVDTCGVKTVSITTTGQEKTHFTVMLACCADGTKLKLLLMFKRKTIPKENFPRSVVTRCNEKGGNRRASYTEVAEWLDKSWKSVKVSTIRSGFMKAGIVSESEEITDSEDSDAENELSDTLPENILEMFNSDTNESDFEGTSANYTRKTTATTFFSLCQSDEFARSLSYHQVPKYYTWNKRNKKWVPRKSGQAVRDYPGIKSSDALRCVCTVHPSNSECFHLRLLLHEVMGPTSFSDVKTFNPAGRARGVSTPHAQKYPSAVSPYKPKWSGPSVPVSKATFHASSLKTANSDTILVL